MSLGSVDGKCQVALYTIMITVADVSARMSNNLTSFSLYLNFFYQPNRYRLLFVWRFPVHTLHMAIVANVGCGCSSVYLRDNRWRWNWPSFEQKNQVELLKQRSAEIGQHRRLLAPVKHEQAGSRPLSETFVKLR